ncbi:MAG: trypsin-like peptidase domain-containing protein, partial [Longicatena sp.]
SATNMSVKEVANATMNSVVEIKTESVSTNSFFQQAVQSGAGSGVILSKDGYIVTNNHVINGANKVSVATKDGKKYDAKLIGSDAATDLAVIKIETTDLIPVVLGESSKLEVGDNAIAIGNPLGELGGTVTTGIISALDRAITIDNQTMHLLQTNAAINPGNSGGGLFNDQGQLIGIVNAKSGGENIEGLGFAIPIDRAKTIITNLIENGYVKDRASLGVTLTLGGSSNPFAQEKESQQVYIYKVSEGKAADKAGLKAGDQILKIDNEKVTTISNVTNVINTHKPGDSVKLSILRDSETKVVSVTLGVSEPTQTQQKEG